MSTDRMKLLYDGSQESLEFITGMLRIGALNKDANGNLKLGDGYVMPGEYVVKDHALVFVCDRDNKLVNLKDRVV